MFQTVFAIIALLSAPVFMGTVGWGLYLLTDHMPLWLWAAAMAMNIIAVLGVACLIDTRRSKAGLPPL